MPPSMPDTRVGSANPLPMIYCFLRFIQSSRLCHFNIAGVCNACEATGAGGGFRASSWPFASMAGFGFKPWRTLVVQGLKCVVAYLREDQ